MLTPKYPPFAVFMEQRLAEMESHGFEFVLRDVAAKRAILRLHPSAEGRLCGVCDEACPCETVRYLAELYYDHPDYNPKWKP